MSFDSASVPAYSDHKQISFSHEFARLKELLSSSGSEGSTSGAKMDISALTNVNDAHSAEGIGGVAALAAAAPGPDSEAIVQDFVQHLPSVEMVDHRRGAVSLAATSLTLGNEGRPETGLTACTQNILSCDSAISPPTATHSPLPVRLAPLPPHDTARGAGPPRAAHVPPPDQRGGLLGGSGGSGGGGGAVAGAAGVGVGARRHGRRPRDVARAAGGACAPAGRGPARPRIRVHPSPAARSGGTRARPRSPEPGR